MSRLVGTEVASSACRTAINEINVYNFSDAIHSAPLYFDSHAFSTLCLENCLQKIEIAKKNAKGCLGCGIRSCD